MFSVQKTAKIYKTTIKKTKFHVNSLQKNVLKLNVEKHNIKMGTKTRKPLQEGLLCMWMLRWRIKGSGTTRLALLVLKNITSNQLASDVSSVF